MEIVEFIYKEKIKTGRVILRNKKILVETSSGREYTIDSSQIFLSESGYHNGVQLGEVEERRIKLSKEINLKDLWEVVKDEKKLTVEGLAKLWFGDDNVDPDKKGALLKTLFSEDNIFFKFKKNRIIPRSEDVIFQRKIQIEREKEWNTKINSFLKSIKKGENVQKGEYEEIVKYLKDFCAKGKSSSSYGKIKNLLKALNIANEGELYKFLISIGVLQENENLTLIKYDIPVEFPRKLKQLKVSLKLAEGVEKFKDSVMTIDPEDAVTYDDALMVEGLNREEISFVVNIADPLGLEFAENKFDEILKEVCKRGITIYSPDTKIDLLPEHITNSLSLKEGEEKPAISIFIRMNKKGIQEYRIMNSIVEVEKNLSYEEMDRYKEHPVIKAGKFIESWRVESKDGFKMMREALEIRIDEKGKILPRRVAPTPSRVAVSEFMGIASYVIALYCLEKGIPIFFRQLRLRGDENEIQQCDFNDPVVFFQTMGRIETSITSTYPGPHKLTGYEIYAWGTSPLRRGFDFINILQLSYFLQKNKLLFTKEEITEILGKIEQSKSKAETCMNERYFYFLSKFIEESLENLPVEGLIASVRDRETIVYVQDICRFVSIAKRNEHKIYSRVKLYLKVDSKRGKIKGVEI